MWLDSQGRRANDVNRYLHPTGEVFALVGTVCCRVEWLSGWIRAFAQGSESRDETRQLCGTSVRLPADETREFVDKSREGE